MKRFELIVEENGENYNFYVTNNGFMSCELLGFLEIERNSVIKQLKHPECFEKVLIDENGNRIKIEDKEINNAEN